MKYQLTHTTTYDYESPVFYGRQIVRKRPRDLEFQRVHNFHLHIQPTPSWSQQDLDYFGNARDVVEILQSHERFEVACRSTVHVGPRPINQQLPLFLARWEDVAERLTRDPAFIEEREMQYDSPFVRRHPLLRAFAERVFTPGRPILEAVLALNALIHNEFTYDPSYSEISTPLGQVLRDKRGVCQDFSHVAIGALRSIGLAARYVSGYLETIPPKGQKRLVGADASHAWASVFLPDHGWVAFDPTNNLLPGERHIVAAWGRDFSDVSPLRGVVHGGGAHHVQVSVDVAPLR
ncbi:MAG: transglutaminase family protein [Polyangiaceae bacterium]|nr:transglutaminase family protein [Polyangiaceae bacterium]